MPTPVSDARSNANDQIARAAAVLGPSVHRHKVFDAIASGKRKVKTVGEIAERTGLSRKQVLTAGKHLADNQLVAQVKQDGDTAYEKDRFLTVNKTKILSLARDRRKLATFPTKTNPRSQRVDVSLRVDLATKVPKVVTVDDIASFAAVRRVSAAPRDLAKVPEARFKAGVQSVVGERGVFRDWGGERNDLWSTRVILKRARIASVIVFKGPGTTGRLTPKKMGKNGDQIQRLFESDAQLFIVQYWDQIDESVVRQMDTFARVKAIATGRDIYYGIIDGWDSARLIAAYPNAFAKRVR